ncbi:MAG: tetratricopeptide repeat protein [Planctomycetota bacterium]
MIPRNFIKLCLIFIPFFSVFLLSGSGCNAPESHLESGPGLTADAPPTPIAKDNTFTGDPDEALAAGDYSKAIGLLNQQVKQDPESAELYIRLGNAYYCMGEGYAADPDLGGDPGSAFADGCGYFEKALSLGAADAGFGLARSLYMNGSFEAAQNALAAYLQHKPDHGAALALSGKIKKGMIEALPVEEADSCLAEAIDVLKRSITLDPNLGEAYLTLGDCYLQQGDQAAAISSYIAGIEACPDQQDLHSRMIYMASAPDCPNCREMIGLYTRIIEERKDQVPSDALGRLWWFKGAWYQQKGYAHYAGTEYDLAAKAYTGYIECLDFCVAACTAFKADVDLARASARLSRGWCYMKLEHYEEAENDFFAALPFYPDDENMILAIDTLGFEISKAQGNQGALEFFRRLTSHWGERHQWWNDYGFFSLETNMVSSEPNEKFQETYDVFQRALELKPDYPRYINDSAMLVDYYLDPEGRRKDEVEGEYRKAWKLGKEAYESPFTDEAEKAIQFSAFTDALVNLSRLYLRQGRIDESRALLEELLTANPERREGLMLKGVFDQLSEKDRSELVKAPGFYKNLLIKTARAHLDAGRLRDSALVVQELFTVDAEGENTKSLVDELNKAIEKYNASRKESKEDAPNS